jgi:hypothetical protein
MAWFADLTPCTYFQPHSDKLLAVGWLERDHPFEQGPADLAFCDRFAEMIWNQGRHFPDAFFGSHGCTLCDTPDAQRNSDGSRTVESYGLGLGGMSYNGVKTDVGITNIFVPGEGVVYVAPSLVLHYMVDHGYLPPPEFREALLRCPPVGSDAYYDAFERNGPEHWREWARRRGAKEPVARPVTEAPAASAVTQEREEERIYAGVVTLRQRTLAPPVEHVTVPADLLDGYIGRITELLRASYARVAVSQDLGVHVRLSPEAPPRVWLDVRYLRNPPLVIELHRKLQLLPPPGSVREPVFVKLKYHIVAEGAPVEKAT